MVKIRGYRVELGEIERAIASHPDIADTGVVAWDREPGEKHLVAYLVVKKGSAATVDKFRNFLKEKLPDYMIPSAFVFLDSLPLTNGKLDRKALPKPDDGRPELGTAFVEAGNEIEVRLVKIWEEVLNVRPIGVTDDFFDLGGHSLLASQLFNRLADEFGRLLPLSVLVDSPTIRSLATHCQSTTESGRNSEYLVKLYAGKEQKIIFCFPYIGGFKGDFFVFARLARLIDLGFSFYGLRARGTDGKSQPHYRVEEMAVDYVKEIQSLQPHGPYYMIGECGGAKVAYETARQLRERGEKVALLVILDDDTSTALSRYIWRRITGRLRHRLITIAESAAWNYYRTQAKFHMEVLRQRRGTGKLRYMLSLCFKTAIAMASRVDDRLSLESRRPSHRKGDNGQLSSRALTKNERIYWLTTRTRYRPRPYNGRVTLLVNEEWYQWYKNNDSDDTLGWSKLATEGVDVYRIPGNHFTYITAPENLKVLVTTIKECLTNAEVGTV